MTIAAEVILGLILAKWLAQDNLERLNRRHALAHSGAVPAAFQGVMDEATYARSIRYTLARNRLNRFDDAYRTVILVLVLFSGVLPPAFEAVRHGLGDSAWAMGLFLLMVGLALAVPGLPVDWHEQFRLEAAFGFNTSTPKTWWLDRLKGFLLLILLGYPLLVLILKTGEWAGSLWWAWACGAVLAFQWLVAVLAPVLILPLFNRFTPLPAGSLRERLLRLARRTAFRARHIQVMDGSKRSRHANAFFTGFGRFRKIVLFDTLIEQLSEPELEAVLAHEIGHFKLKHLLQMLCLSAAGSLAGFYALSRLAAQPWFGRAFGFEPGGLAPALLLFGLLSGVVTFWLAPQANAWSRRQEYQADAFAAGVMGETDSLVCALRKLNEKNLSHLTPHPLYSGFHYSHPTLLEREAALARTP
jgi:STE24 endopeptidase